MLTGKYIWIWRLANSAGGDIAALVKKARELDLSGYIVKTHDGGSFWQQSAAVTALKKSGLSCGAWGYSYGQDIDGEVAAIRETLDLQPDFYVIDVEKEYETPEMKKSGANAAG